MPWTSFQPSRMREDSFEESFGSFWKESESVSSWIYLTSILFMSVLDKESTRKYLPINVSEIKTFSL